MKFEEIVSADYKQYKDIREKFAKVNIEDLDTLFKLAQVSWEYASRWSEIQAQATQISSQYGLNKTDFTNFCYQTYRQLQELHTTCRSWFRLGIEEKRAVERGGINDM